MKRSTLQTLLIGGLAIAGGLPLAGELAAQQTQTITVSRVPTRPGASGWLGLGFEYQERGSTATIRIGSVWKGGPAERAGMRTGDLLLTVNGAPARMDMLQSLLSRMAPGDPVSLKVRRETNDMEIVLEADPRPASATLVVQEMQTQLDSVRRVIATRLDSLAISGGSELPTLRVQPLEESDSSVTIFVKVDSNLGGQTTRLTLDTLQRNTLVWNPPTEHLIAGGSGGSTIQAAPRMIQLQADVVGVSPPNAVLTPSPSTAPRAGTVLFTESGSLPPNPFVVGLNRVAGAAMHEVDPRLEVYLGVSEGLLITEVTEGTPASASGLRSGDIVIEADSVGVSTIDGLRKILSRTARGHELTVLRQGARRTIRLLR